MTIKEKHNIRRLHFMHRYSRSSIGRLLGISRQRVGAIIDEEGSVTFSPNDECVLCSSETVTTFFIDGNEDNNKPQNVIVLCEADRRRVMHLQARRKQGIIRPLL